MISLGLNLLKQKSKCPPKMTLFQGSTGLTSGMSRENQTSSNERRCGFWRQHSWTQGFFKCSPSQSLPPSLLGSPASQESLYYGTYCSLQYRAETKLYSSLKVSRGLTSCFMNEYLKEKYLLQHKSDQQLQCSGSCDLCLRSVEKRLCGNSREEVVFGDHPLEGSLCSRHWTGYRGKTIPEHQAFIT